MFKDFEKPLKTFRGVQSRFLVVLGQFFTTTDTIIDNFPESSHSMKNCISLTKAILMQSLNTSKSIHFVSGFTKRGKVESSQHDMLRSSPGEVSLTGLHSPLYTYTFYFQTARSAQSDPLQTDSLRFQYRSFGWS